MIILWIIKINKYIINFMKKFMIFLMKILFFLMISLMKKIWYFYVFFMIFLRAVQAEKIIKKT